MGQPREIFHGKLDHREARCHHRELLQQTAMGVDELGQEGAVEEQHLGIRDRRQQALPEEGAIVSQRGREAGEM